jgi:hypothetical protein
MDTAGAERVVREMVAAWLARNLEAVVLCLTDDVRWYDPAMPAGEQQWGPSPRR